MSKIKNKMYYLLKILFGLFIPVILVLTALKFSFWIILLLPVYLYSYYIEPNRIKISYTSLPNFNLSKRIILISDIHLGIFKNQKFLQKVVTHINKIPNYDLVLIAGDLTYEPTNSQDLKTLFAPLKQINTPVISVLGNHDVEKPGPKIREELKRALHSNKAKLLNNQIYKHKDLTILGLGSYLNNEDETNLIKDLPPKSLILTHNPDTTLRFPQKASHLTVCGHTHIGQIQIPFLYKKVIPTKGSFAWEGFQDTKKGPLFISGGLGEVILPFRLGISPTIYVLDL